jgi:hypothetical protein
MSPESMTVTIPGELHARIESAHTAYRAALEAVTDHHTPANARVLAAHQRRLSELYRDLVQHVLGSALLLRAVVALEGRFTDRAQWHQNNAGRLDGLRGGDAA